MGKLLCMKRIRFFRNSNSEHVMRFLCRLRRLVRKRYGQLTGPICILPFVQLKRSGNLLCVGRFLIFCDLGGCGFGREYGNGNGKGNGNGNGNGNEKGGSNGNGEGDENEPDDRAGDNAKVLATLQSDVFLQGHRHSPNSYQSTFFDFPTNSQYLICYINSGFFYWRFEHRPSKSFAIPSLQIYPFPQVNESSGSLQLANHVLMITFISGSLECTIASIALLIPSFENGKSQKHLDRSGSDGDNQGNHVFWAREVSPRVRDC